MSEIAHITGLAQDERIQAYLAEVYAVRYQKTVGGIPVFENHTGELLVGGFKGFYTIVPDAACIETLEMWRAGRSGIHYNFSTPKDLFRSKRLDMVLTLPPCIRIEDRFSLYERNVCKHVRRAEASPVEYVVEAPHVKWYDLYSLHCAWLGSTPHPLERYRAIERYMGDGVVSVNAYDQGTLIGTLYCLRASDYLQLLVIASDVSYRPMRVDNGLYDAAIRYAIREGIRTVDFGPTMRKDESHWNIKKGHGAQTYFFTDRSFMSLPERLTNTGRHALSRARAVFKKATGR